MPPPSRLMPPSSQLHTAIPRLMPPSSQPDRCHSCHITTAFRFLGATMHSAPASALQPSPCRRASTSCAARASPAMAELHGHDITVYLYKSRASRPSVGGAVHTYTQRQRWATCALLTPTQIGGCASGRPLVVPPSETPWSACNRLVIVSPIVGLVIRCRLYSVIGIGRFVPPLF